MVRQGSGAIVNVSAIASIRQVGYSCMAYGASKAAVNQLTQSIAIKYADKGIRANTILPGLMHTPTDFVETGEDEEDNKEVYAWVRMGET